MDRKPAYRGVEGRIARLAASQDGVVAIGQLLSMGLSRSAVEGRVRRGRLFPLYRGVYAVGHPAVTTDGERRAALLACGDGAVLSHRTAAVLWGLRRSNARLDRRDDLYQRRSQPSSRHQDSPRSAAADGGRLSPVLSADEFGPHSPRPEAAVVTPRALERAIDEAVRLGHFDRAAVALVLDSNRRRPGRGRLAAVVAAHRPGSTMTRSSLEELFLGSVALMACRSPKSTCRSVLTWWTSSGLSSG